MSNASVDEGSVEAPELEYAYIYWVPKMSFLKETHLATDIYIYDIVSLLDRVVEVKPTYILLLSDIQSPKGHLNLNITLVFCKTPIEGEELFLMTKFEILN